MIFILDVEDCYLKEAERELRNSGVRLIPAHPTNPPECFYSWCVEIEEEELGYIIVELSERTEAKVGIQLTSHKNLFFMDFT